MPQKLMARYKTKNILKVLELRKQRTYGSGLCWEFRNGCDEYLCTASNSGVYDDNSLQKGEIKGGEENQKEFFKEKKLWQALGDQIVLSDDRAPTAERIRYSN